VDGHVRAAQRREHADLGGTDDAPLRDDELARLHVLPRLPDVEPRRRGNEDLHLASLGFRVLHPHDGIGPLGQGRTRHDADGLPLPDGLRGHLSGGHILQDVEDGGSRLARKGRVGGDDGIAVHGRVGQRRDVAPRDDVLAEDAAEGRGNGDLLAPKGMNPLEYGLQGLLHLDHRISLQRSFSAEGSRIASPSQPRCRDGGESALGLCRAAIIM